MLPYGHAARLTLHGVVDIAATSHGLVVLRDLSIALLVDGRIIEVLERDVEDGLNVALHGGCPTRDMVVVVTDKHVVLRYAIQADGVKFLQAIRLKGKPDHIEATTQGLHFTSTGQREIRQIPWSSNRETLSSKVTATAKPIIRIQGAGDHLLVVDESGASLHEFCELAGEIVCAWGATHATSSELIIGDIRIPMAGVRTVTENRGLVCITRQQEIHLFTKNGSHVSVIETRADTVALGLCLYFLAEGQVLYYQLLELVIDSAPLSTATLVGSDRVTFRRPNSEGAIWYNADVPIDVRVAAASESVYLAVAASMPSVHILTLRTGSWTDVATDDRIVKALAWHGEHLVVATESNELLLISAFELTDIVALPYACIWLSASSHGIDVVLADKTMYALKVTLDNDGIHRLSKIWIQSLERKVSQLARISRELVIYLSANTLYSLEGVLFKGVDFFNLDEHGVWTFGRGMMSFIDIKTLKTLFVLEVPGMPVHMDWSRGIIEYLPNVRTPATDIQDLDVIPFRAKYLVALLALRREAEARRDLALTSAKSATLEQMLYETIYEPDLLAKVWLFCDRLPGVLASLLRKTDLPAWKAIFNAIGPAYTIFAIALEQRDFRASVNMMLAVASTSEHDVASLADELFPLLVEAKEYALIGEVLRFLDRAGSLSTRHISATRPVLDGPG
ncbi:hypothetical protein PYCC9005_003201 [Savitreella phatthalungensis]